MSAPRPGLEPGTNRLTDVLVAWPFRAETVRVVGCYGNPMRLASTVVRLRALAKNHGNSELARVQFGRIRKRNRPVPRGASAAGRCRWTSSASSRRLRPQRPVRLLRAGFRLLLRRIIYPLRKPLRRHPQRLRQPEEGRHAGEAPAVLPVAQRANGHARPPGQLSVGQPRFPSQRPQVSAEARGPPPLPGSRLSERAWAVAGT